MKKGTKRALIAASVAASAAASAAALTLVSKYRYGRSALATLVEAAQRASGLKKTFLGTDPVRFENFLDKKRQEQQDANSYTPPKGLKNVLFEDIVGQMKVFHLGLNGMNKKCVVFLHGGSYVSNISYRHWLFLDILASETSAEIVVPLYPLAPTHDYDEAYSELLDMYSNLLKRYDAQDIIFMGDSAGGGLALGFCEGLADEKLPMPAHIVAISPLVDLSLRNPDIKNYFDLDPLLAPWGVAQVGEMWADGDNVLSPRLSPLFGDVSVLPPVTITVGTREILYPDVIKFTEKLDAAHVPCDLVVGQGLNHCWPIYPTPEALGFFEKLVALIGADSSDQAPEA